MSEIIRGSKKGGYTKISNLTINDKRLSWEARGLLAYLLSKPDDWCVSVVNIINSGPAGINKVRRILKELEKFGYLQRTRVQGEDGRFRWVSTIREHPFNIPSKKIRGKKPAKMFENLCAALTDKEIEMLTKLPYHAFLSTQYWDIVRQYKIELAGGKCERCGSNKRLHVHHLTYKHRGEEFRHLDDLMVLCRSCHREVHGLDK